MKEEFFGGVPTILFDDFAQLPPVGDILFTQTDNLQTLCLMKVADPMNLSHIPLLSVLFLDRLDKTLNKLHSEIS